MNIISVKKLTKSFGEVKAVDSVSLEVAPGIIFGFLGPNGAGKTTTLHMLATLLPIESGDAYIAGYNVKTQPQEVRKHIGYVGQAGGADRLASGREDLMLQAQLYGIGAPEAAKRASELAKALDLEEFFDRRVSTYSGGQRRRLDVALGIMHKPDVLFLDEPTTGLDPQNRANLWVQIRKLRDGGTTIFLTTHYLEEADTLSDRIAIMDHGKIVAEGSSRELKQRVSGDSVSLCFRDGPEIVVKAKALFKGLEFVREIDDEDGGLRLYVAEGAEALPVLLRELDKENIAVKTVTLSEPTLDDVFLHETGRSLRDGAPAREGAAK